jgi:hypothetical protein
MNPLRLTGWPLALAACLAGGCRPEPPAAADPPGPPWFADVTERAGLHFVHDAGPVGSYFMPQAIGSGAALFDYDGDGRLDIYLVHNGGPAGARNRLYHQEADGTFRDASAGSGLDVAGHGMGVAVGDVNNDGRPDLLLTQYRGLRLFLNQGGGAFREVTGAAGLADPGWGASAAFLDYDRDGWLDLVVVHYVDYDPTMSCTAASGVRDYCPPRTFQGRVTRLFHNRGLAPGGEGPPRVPRFDDVTVASGLGRLAGPGLGVLCADFDGDGWPDVFVANDGKPNHLWVNRHDGTFKEDAAGCGVAYNGLGQAEAGMGVAWGDVDGDGLGDLFVTHLTEESNRLWRQGPRGLYRDRTAAAGLGDPLTRGTGFGTALLDVDHDGWLDLAVANGRVSKASAPGNPGLGPHWGLYAERNRLFANDGTGRFRDVGRANPEFCGTAGVARGLAVGDVDNDGALDLLVTTAAGPARLYRNVAPGRGHWLLVRAVDPALRRDSYGAEIAVLAGGRRRVALINPAGSYLCSSDPRAHFGLGAAGRVDELTVIWPDGTAEEFPGGDADRQVVLRKGEGTRVRGKGER